VTVSPDVARRTWRAVEPYHAMIYFVPEAQEEYAALGYDVKGNRAAGYFPARAAAMGAVTADVVQATFFNFSRLAVEFGMAGAWEIASPEQLVQARYRAADRALRRLCGDLLDEPAVAEAAALARTAAEGCTPYGRPLYAANAGLAWPDEPHLQLFHAQTLLREFRGDGHIAALVTEQVSGLEAAVLHVAMEDTWQRSGLQKTRAYSDEEWDSAVVGLTERGWLNPDGTFTDEGRAHRQRVEDLTDSLSVCAYERIGVAGCERLRELTKPVVRAVLDGGGLPVTSSR
jgi:hypothetical protein